MMDVVKKAQVYYDKPHESLKTRVLPAALMSLDECWKLKGVHHITLPPKRIEELAAITASDADARCASIFSTQKDYEELQFELDEIERIGKEAIDNEAVFEREMQAEGEMPHKLMKEVRRVLVSYNLLKGITN